MTERAFCAVEFRVPRCLLQDDDKPMIEVMDQLSPAIADSFVSVVVSDAVSCMSLAKCRQSLKMSR